MITGRVQKHFFLVPYDIWKTLSTAGQLKDGTEEMKRYIQDHKTKLEKADLIPLWLRCTVTVIGFLFLVYCV